VLRVRWRGGRRPRVCLVIIFFIQVIVIIFVIVATAILFVVVVVASVATSFLLLAGWQRGLPLQPKSVDTGCTVLD
jgi:hypothetical protein